MNSSLHHIFYLPRICCQNNPIFLPNNSLLQTWLLKTFCQHNLPDSGERQNIWKYTKRKHNKELAGALQNGAKTTA